MASEKAPALSEDDALAMEAAAKAPRAKTRATHEDRKGLVIVHTGKENGSAAFGMILRSDVYDTPCAVVNFIKGGMSSGARDLTLAKLSGFCAFQPMGESTTSAIQHKSRDTEMAQAAWDEAKELIRDPADAMVLPDEINIAIRNDFFVDAAEVMALLRGEEPEITDVVLIPKSAYNNLIEATNLLTQMELVGRPFRSGIKAQINTEH